MSYLCGARPGPTSSWVLGFFCFPDFELNSSPRRELFSSPGLLLAHPWSAQPESVPGVPNSGVSLECPTPEYLYQERVGMFEVKKLVFFKVFFFFFWGGFGVSRAFGFLGAEGGFGLFGV